MTITEDKLDLDDAATTAEQGVRRYAVGETPDEYTYTNAASQWCREPAPDDGQGFRCSITAGHAGPQHVAANANRIVAVWDRVEPTPPEPVVPDDAPDEVKQAVEAALAAYKQRVRNESFRVAAQQGWCDNGLNETLRNLDLPEKRTYYVWTQIPVGGTTVPARLAVNDAMSREDAEQQVRDGKVELTHVVRDAIYTAITAKAGQLLAGAEPVRPTALVVDGPDFTLDEREAAVLADARWVTRHTCDDGVRHLVHGHLYCTRPRGHQNHGFEAHAAGSNTTVRAVWTTDGSTPTFIDEAVPTTLA